jgi:hypothetical protein
VCAATSVADIEPTNATIHKAHSMLLPHVTYGEVQCTCSHLQNKKKKKKKKKNYLKFSSDRIKTVKTKKTLKNFFGAVGSR